jgi:hypothetical protein
VRPTLYRVTREIAILCIAVRMTIRIWAPPENPDPCGLPNSLRLHHGAYSGAITLRMFASVLLQGLPSNTSHRLLKRVTWTEADAVFPAHVPLRQLVGRVARRG